MSKSAYSMEHGAERSSLNPYTVAPARAAGGNRVCDKCLTRKTKCNLQRPTCSRCLDSGITCTYSIKKRKPGPNKGSGFNKRRAKAEASESPTTTSPDSVDQSILQHPPSSTNIEDGFPKDSSATSLLGPKDVLIESLSNMFQNISLLQVPQDFPESLKQGILITLDQDQERSLLELFLTYIHPVLPIFRPDLLFYDYEAGNLPRPLLLAIWAVTARFSKLEAIVNASNNQPWLAGEPFAEELRVMQRDQQRPVACVGLCEVKKELLVAFYRFSSTPGREAWTSVGRLVGLAYRCGLHQIDNPRHCLFWSESTTAEDMEEWRCVWWSIWKTDMMCNCTASTPFNIEFESMRVAMPQTTTLGPEVGGMTSSTQLFLETDTSSLQDLARSISERGNTQFGMNLSLLATCLCREACDVRRLLTQNPKPKLRSRMDMILTNCTAIKLSLAPSYLEPARLPLESDSGHQLRLTALMHIYMVEILANIPVDFRDSFVESRARRASSWDICCARIGQFKGIMQHWETRYIDTMCPTSALMVWGALSVALIQSRLRGELGAEREDDATTHLTLLLEQMAVYWQLPRILLEAAQRLRRLLRDTLGQLSLDDVLPLTTQILWPMSPRYHNAAESAKKALQPSTGPAFPMNAFESSFDIFWGQGFPDLSADVSPFWNLS